MLRVGDAIHGNGGTIRTNLPAATDELLSVIALASRETASVGKAGLALRLTQAGEPPMLAHVLPLAHGDLCTRLQPKAAAAVFIAGVAGGDNDAEAMSVAFDLTRMETRVLAHLLAGQTFNQTAQALGVARTTVRTHLNNIFLKTGGARQNDLIRVASRTAAIVRS